MSLQPSLLVEVTIDALYTQNVCPRTSEIPPTRTTHHPPLIYMWSPTTTIHCSIIYCFLRNAPPTGLVCSKGFITIRHCGPKNMDSPTTRTWIIRASIFWDANWVPRPVNSEMAPKNGIYERSYPQSNMPSIAFGTARSEFCILPSHNSSKMASNHSPCLCENFQHPAIPNFPYDVPCKPSTLHVNPLPPPYCTSSHQADPRLLASLLNH